jgi:hypothetical protein
MAKITEITVQGFKSIRDAQTLHIGPLTIISGANSAGKSSIMQPLLVLKQSIESPYDPGALKLLGVNAKFSSGEQILTREATGNISNDFSIGIKVGERKITSTYSWTSKKGFELSRMECEGSESLQLTPDTEIEILKNRMDIRFTEIFGKKAPEFTKDFNIFVQRDRCFFKIVANLHKHTFTDLALADEVVIALKNFIHLPGLRGNPERTYPVSAVGSLYPGLFQDYTASLIVSWESQKAVEKISGLRNDMKKLGLSWKVWATKKDDTQVEIQVGRLPTPQRGGALDLVSIADVGLGVSQTLPVLVALHAASKDQMIYIEQPEIHLHPRAQVIMADIIVSAVKRGVSVILETHSSIMIRKFQTLVATKRIKPDEVSLNWFSRNELGYTTVRHTTPDDDGAYGDWPEDFDDVSLRIENEYLSAVSKNRLRRKGQ